jgi:hypothetical protein
MKSNVLRRQLLADARRAAAPRRPAAIMAPIEVRRMDPRLIDEWDRILGEKIPGCVLYGITALKLAPLPKVGRDRPPVESGWVFATHSDTVSKKTFSVDGLEILSSPGAGPLEGDFLVGRVWRPSIVRTILENLAPSRDRIAPARTAGIKGVSDLLLAYEEDWGSLHDLMDRATKLAPLLGSEPELEVLSKLVDLHVRAVPGARKPALVTVRKPWGIHSDAVAD